MVYFNYILIFSAATLFFLLVILMSTKYLQEKLEFRRPKKYEELRRFIKPETLLARQILASLITTSLFFIGQLFFGVKKMQIAVPVACGFGIGAFFAVFAYYRHKLVKRKEDFESKILDLTMGLSNSMRSGLALGQSLELLNKRMKGPMQEELTTLLGEYRTGKTLPEAFERMYARMPSEDLYLLSTAVSLSSKSGGSLTDVLEEMSLLIRERREFQERLKNMTAQGRFEATVISCAPFAAFILLYSIDPVLMRPLITTGAGWLTVGAVCLLITIGYLVLKKITTVEV